MQKKYGSFRVGYLLDNGYKLTEQDIRRLQFLDNFPKWQPTDLPDYLEFLAEHYPDQPVVQIRLKNEHPDVVGLVVEPWGSGDEFPTGTNYHLVLLLIPERLPEQPIPFPEQLTFSTGETKLTTVIGELIQKDGFLILYAASFIHEIVVFTEDGTGTMIPG